MTRKPLILGGIFGLCILLLEFSPQLGLHLPLLYFTPISFYGRVLDQNGVPVSGARVQFSVSTTPWEQPIKFNTISKSNGEFKLTGKHGLALFVGVAKDGYYQVPDSKGNRGSRHGFDYGRDYGKGIHSPSEASPVIFVLRRAGALEPLIARRGLRVPLVPDGTVYFVSLRKSRGADYRIALSCRSEWMPDSGGAFDWSFQIKVENGELVERTDGFAFEAPTSGYRPGDSIGMSKSLQQEQWKDRVIKSYFIRFYDGIAARATVEIHAGAEPHVWLDSYLNPRSGSRNLESGPPPVSTD